MAITDAKTGRSMKKATNAGGGAARASDGRGASREGDPGSMSGLYPSCVDRSRPMRDLTVAEVSAAEDDQMGRQTIDLDGAWRTTTPTT
jgi:hypothetical protein